MRPAPSFHILLQYVQEGIVLLDMDQKICFASDKYLAMTGYSAEELAVQDAMQRVHPDDRASLGAAFAAAIAAPKQPQFAAYRAQTKDGRLLNFEVRGSYLPQGVEGWTEQPCVLVAVDDRSAEHERQREIAQREAFQRTLLDNLNDGILVLGMDERPRYVSPGYARLMGNEPDALLGQITELRVHPDDVARVRKNFRTAISGGQPQAVDYRLTPPSGTVHVRGYCRYLPEGIADSTEPCVLVVARDIGPELEAQQRLTKSERFHRAVLEQSEDVMLLLEADSRIRWVSPSVERLLGFEPEPLIGRIGFDLVVPEERRHMMDVFASSINTPSEGRETEFRARDAEGRTRVLAGISTPADQALGGGLLVRLRDVTRSRLSEEALLRSERSGLLSEVLAGLGHELRNPLLAISVNAELLSAAKLEPDDLESAKAIQDQARRLRLLLDQVMNAPLDPKPEIMGAQSVLQQALQQARRRFGPLADKVTVKLEVAEGCPALQALPGRLELALANVMLNAFQALPAGGTLRLAAKPDQDGVLLCVIDNGAGIGQAALDELFDPFYTTRATAAGLGLSTSKRIIESHGGRIWALRNDPGLVVHAWLPSA